MITVGHTTNDMAKSTERLLGFHFQACFILEPEVARGEGRGWEEGKGMGQGGGGGG